MRKNLYFICWILVTNFWLEFDHIRFLLATFDSESEGLGQAMSLLRHSTYGSGF
jgi:hypothetical protein